MSTAPSAADLCSDRRLRVVAGQSSDGAAVAATLDGATIRVVVPTGEVPWRVQILAVTVTDLLGRLFPRIAFDCDPAIPAHGSLPPGPATLRGRLESAARHGGFPAMQPVAEPTVTVRLGAHDSEAPGESGVTLVADGGGWVSYNGLEPSQLPEGDWGGDIPIGPLLAACRAAAQATQVVLTGGAFAPRVPASVYADALRHAAHVRVAETATPAHGSPELDAVLVGAGSIGGAAAYTLAHVPSLTGSLVVADPQRLEAKNLDRALLATSEAAAVEENKVAIAERALAHVQQLQVTAWPGTLEAWVASRRAEETLPLILAAVDSRHARRAIQDCLPLELVNAACNPAEVHVSGHRTGEGPCVCCLHMAEVLDESAVRVRLVKADTGLNEAMIQQYLTNDQPMPAQMVRHIENFRGLPAGALAGYEGKTLEELRVGALLYGATPVATDSGTVAVAAPYITALAGVLLAGEALKAAIPELHPYRLGPQGPATKYAENPLSGAHQAMLTNPPRWPTHECLCRSTRRSRILAHRYGPCEAPPGSESGEGTP